MAWGWFAMLCYPQTKVEGSNELVDSDRTHGIAADR